MTRTSRWATGGLAAAIPLGLLAMPLAAQQQQQQGREEARPQVRSGQIPQDDLSRAREMAALIEQGQLNLNDASILAAKHVKGTALSATADVMPGGTHPKSGQPAQPAEEAKPGGPSAEEPADGMAQRHLMYEVCVFASDKIHVVRVDGAARKVIDVTERKTLERRVRPAGA